MTRPTRIAWVFAGLGRLGASVVALSLLVAAPAWGQTRILEELETGRFGDRIKIRIEFSTAMQYLDHTPANRGEVLQVRLRPVRGTLVDQDLNGSESLSWRPTEEVPLLNVDYEGSTIGSAQLTLRFQRPVTYEVASSPDFRSLLVTIPAPTAQGTPVPAPAPEAEAAAVPQTPPRSTAKREPAPAPLSGRVERIVRERPFVLNLLSSLGPIDPAGKEPPPGMTDKTLYVTTIALDGRVWHRLRLGYFENIEQARLAKRKLRETYPKAWIARATRQEVAQTLAQSTPVEPAPPPKAPRPDTEAARRRTSDPRNLPPISEERLAALMEQARQAMVRKDYSRAVRLYTKVLRYPDHPYRRAAQEFLGLARERKGQFAHAKAEYERYLQQYPDGEGTERVRQRLLGLTTARAQSTPELRAPRPDQRQTQWDTFGSFSQFYQRDTSVIEPEGSTVDRSALSTDLDYSARRRGDDYDLRARFSGGYEHDFLDDGPGSETRVSSAYLDAATADRRLALSVGRRSRSTGGVLGRFDGALFSYQWTPTTRLNLVTGLPVDSSSDGVHTERLFYGASVDLGTYANAWDFVVFFIEQTIDDVTDRRAVGGEVRYFAPGRSLLGLLDYDISYDVLNTLLVIGNWTLPDRTTINTVIDVRKSPLLTTRNALQGQMVTTVDELQDVYTDDEIRQLAEDRTIDSRSFTLGVSRPVSEKLQASADLTVTNLGDAPASGGVPAIPGTGDDYFLNLQLIGSSLLKPGDIAIVGLRYADTSTARTTSLSLNTRYPVTSGWRVNPRLRVDYRRNDDGSTQWILAPSLRTDYRWKKRYRFELELGAEWSDLELTDTTDESSAYFVSAGYRIDF